MITEEDLALVFQDAPRMAKRVRDSLLANGEKKVYGRGASLTRDGSGGFFYIKRGAVNAYAIGANGGELLVCRCQKDEGCAIEEGMRYEFQPGGEIIRFAAPEDCVMQSSVVQARLLGILRNEKRKMTERFKSVMFSNIDKRLAEMLLEASNRLRSRTLPFTQEKIAGFVGTSREVVSRKLAALKEEGILSTSRGKITVLNREALRDRMR